MEIQDYKLDVLNELIHQWGLDRSIIQNGKPMGQAIKTLEETTELISALNINDYAETVDSIGDIFVTLVMVCGTLGLTLEECANSAYQEIKDRTGHLRPDGIFIKQGDTE